MEIPDYLYHYTNIETLALILKNRTIRFNSLDKMDDLQEKDVSDLKEAAKLVYVSSWTELKNENIPMWKMYASLNEGVRIKLPSDPFLRYTNGPESFSGIPITVTDKTKTNGSGLITYIPISEMISRGFISANVLSGKIDNILFKVDYTDDRGLLCPTLLGSDGSSTKVNFGLVGKHKNTYWDFQKEWRYILTFHKIDLLDLKNITSNMEKHFLSLINGSVEQPFPHYDLHITPKAFEQMEITLSPCISAGNKLIVETLVDYYSDNIKIFSSELTGLISHQ